MQGETFTNHHSRSLNLWGVESSFGLCMNTGDFGYLNFLFLLIFFRFGLYCIPLPLTYWSPWHPSVELQSHWCAIVGGHLPLSSVASNLISELSSVPVSTLSQVRQNSVCQAAPWQARMQSRSSLFPLCEGKAKNWQYPPDCVALC